MTAPTGSELSVSARSAALGSPISPYQVRYYQTYYRDPSPGFCPSGTFNVSNGAKIIWGP